MPLAWKVGKSFKETSPPRVLGRERPGALHCSPERNIQEMATKQSQTHWKDLKPIPLHSCIPISFIVPRKLAKARCILLMRDWGAGETIYQPSYTPAPRLACILLPGAPTQCAGRCDSLHLPGVGWQNPRAKCLLPQHSCAV